MHTRFSDSLQKGKAYKCVCILGIRTNFQILGERHLVVKFELKDSLTCCVLIGFMGISEVLSVKVVLEADIMKSDTKSAALS